MKRLLQILAILVLIIILSACNECHTTHKNSEWVEIEISNHSGTHISTELLPENSFIYITDYKSSKKLNYHCENGNDVYGNIAYGVTAFRVLGRKPVIKTKMKLK